MWNNNRSRRHFLSQIGAGFGMTALQAILAGETVPSAVAVDPTQPWLPRPPLRKAKAKNVIFLYMVGGPSSIDTINYKPDIQKLAGKKVPESLRRAVEATKHKNVFVGAEDAILPSPWKFQQHGQSGAWVSELMPHLAKEVDHLCFVHSMQADSNNHAPASIQMHTGETIGGKASIGSWLTYGLGTANQNLPAYVLLFEAGPLGGATNYSNGVLPAAFQGTRLRTQGPVVADLLPPAEFAPHQRTTLDTIRELNQQFGEKFPANPELEARIASYELAWRMQSAAAEVGDIAQESTAVRQSYGCDSPDPIMAKYARKCLMARRLVERGVRFVQVYDMWEKDGWDAHEKLKENHELHARATDQPIAALLRDLRQTGLWDETLVICASEFGRTPMQQGKAGRQHNAAGFSIWMAGGAVRPGFHFGNTDEIGLLATEQPVHVRDLHATILAALGIDHDALYFCLSV